MFNVLVIANNNTKKMYEPVANTCVTTILSRYPSDNNIADYNNQSSVIESNDDSQHHHQRKEAKNIDNKLKANDAVPEKPPRRVKLQKLHKNHPQAQELKKLPPSVDDIKSESSVVAMQPEVAKKIKLPEDNHRVDIEDINRMCVESERNYKNRFQSVGVQVSPAPPYRLRVLPKRLRPAKSDPEKCDCNKDRATRCCTVTGRWLFSQCGLTVIIVIWALLGAAAFHQTEGPREQEQAEELATLQYNLAVSLATELRQVVPHEPVWLSMVQNYFAKHESLLLNAVSSGYGEGGGGGHIWTYPGCVLFAVSLLTTLGFGAPVPRTTLGRGAAVLFSAIGIPLHFLLVLNIGVLIASKLQRCATSSATMNNAAPRWLKWFPVVAIAIYYILGVVLFGFVRRRDIADSLLFPLDFTATGGVAKTLGHVRVLYALYLEVAVTLAATVVALLQVSAAKGVLHLGLKLGLLTNA